MEVQRRPFAELDGILSKVLAMPKTLEEVGEVLVGATPGDDPLMVLDNLLMTNPLYGWHPPGLFFRYDLVFTGLTFTHRVTADDLATGTVPAGPYLDLVSILVTDHVGDSAILAGPNLDPVDDFRAYAGDDGWLDGCEAGRLCGFRFTSEPGDGGENQEIAGVVEFIPVVDEPDPAATGALADAFVQAVERLGRPQAPTVMTDSVVVEAVLSHPDTWEVMAPFDEVAHQAGIEVRDSQCAASGYDWEAAEADRPARTVANQFRLKPTSERRLRQALDAFDRWRAGDPSDSTEAPTPPRLIPDTLLAEAFGTAIVAHRHGSMETADAHEAIDRFAGEMVARCDGVDQVPYLWLQSVSAAAAGRASEQVELLERAHRVDPGDPWIGEDLGYCRLDQGRVGEAYDLLVRAGAEGPMMDLVSGLTRWSRSDAGRNDRCPCGSGRKFKQCHGRAGGAGELSQADAAIAAYEKPTRLLWTGDLDLPNWITWPGQWADDEVSGPDWRAAIGALDDMGVMVDILLAEGGAAAGYLELRGDLLDGSERAVLDRWGEEKRSLYKVGDGGRLETSAGEVVDCSGDGWVESVEEGTWVVARPLPIGGGRHRVFGGLVTIDDDDAAARVGSVLEGDPSADEVGRLLAGVLHRSHVRTEDLVLCFAVVGPDEVGDLDRWEREHVRLDPTPNPALQVGALDDGTIVLRDDDRFTLVTYSEEAHRAALGRLADDLGSHRVLAEHAVSAAALQQEVMMLDRELLDGPAVPAADPAGEFDSAVLTRVLETALALSIRAGHTGD